MGATVSTSPAPLVPLVPLVPPAPPVAPGDDKTLIVPKSLYPACLATRIGLGLALAVSWQPLVSAPWLYVVVGLLALTAARFAQKHLTVGSWKNYSRPVVLLGAAAALAWSGRADLAGVLVLADVAAGSERAADAGRI
jgi:hypothetical protein